MKAYLFIFLVQIIDIVLSIQQTDVLITLRGNVIANDASTTFKYGGCGLDMIFNAISKDGTLDETEKYSYTMKQSANADGSSPTNFKKKDGSFARDRFYNDVNKFFKMQWIELKEYDFSTAPYFVLSWASTAPDNDQLDSSQTSPLVIRMVDCGPATKKLMFRGQDLLFYQKIEVGYCNQDIEITLSNINRRSLADTYSWKLEKQNNDDPTLDTVFQGIDLTSSTLTITQAKLAEIKAKFIVIRIDVTLTPGDGSTAMIYPQFIELVDCAVKTIQVDGQDVNNNSLQMLAGPCATAVNITLAEVNNSSRRSMTDTYLWQIMKVDSSGSYSQKFLNFTTITGYPIRNSTLVIPGTSVLALKNEIDNEDPSIEIRMFAKIGGYKVGIHPLVISFKDCPNTNTTATTATTNTQANNSATVFITSILTIIILLI